MERKLIVNRKSERHHTDHQRFADDQVTMIEAMLKQIDPLKSPKQYSAMLAIREQLLSSYRDNRPVDNRLEWAKIIAGIGTETAKTAAFSTATMAGYKTMADLSMKAYGLEENDLQSANGRVWNLAQNVSKFLPKKM